MTTDNVQIVMLIFGLLFLATGIVVRVGFWKDWYWKGLKLAYGYIPMGLLFVFWYFKPNILQNIESEFFSYQLPTAILLILSAWFSGRTPKLMKTRWVNWIESNPNRVVEGMTEEVKSGVDWVDKVKSQQAVGAWARAVRRKLPKRAKK